MKSVLPSLILILSLAPHTVFAQEDENPSLLALDETDIPVAEDGAKTVYVTDTLQLRLYAREKARGEVLATLNSGDALTVLDEQGPYSQVRTTEGKEGWVKNFYLIDSIPASFKLKLVEEQLSQRDESILQLEERLQDMTPPEQPDETPDQGLLTELESKVVQLNQENVMMTNEKEQLRKKLVQAELALQHSKQDSDENKIATIDTSEKLPLDLPFYNWLAIVGGGGIIFGFILGYRYYSNKLKKRFYGFRI